MFLPKLQTIMPVPYPVYHSNGGGGSWTEHDTKITIAVLLTFIIMSAIMVVAESVIKKRSILRLLKDPIDAEWFGTMIFVSFTYIMLAIAAIVMIGIGIYSLLF